MRSSCLSTIATTSSTSDAGHSSGSAGISSNSTNLRAPPADALLAPRTSNASTSSSRSHAEPGNTSRSVSPVNSGPQSRPLAQPRDRRARSRTRSPRTKETSPALLEPPGCAAVTAARVARRDRPHQPPPERGSRGRTSAPRTLQLRTHSDATASTVEGICCSSTLRSTGSRSPSPQPRYLYAATSNANDLKAGVGVKRSAASNDCCSAQSFRPESEPDLDIGATLVQARV